MGTAPNIFKVDQRVAPGGGGGGGQLNCPRIYIPLLPAVVALCPGSSATTAIAATATLDYKGIIQIAGSDQLPSTAPVYAMHVGYTPPALAARQERCC